jgi:hypothetical protein
MKKQLIAESERKIRLDSTVNGIPLLPEALKVRG